METAISANQYHIKLAKSARNPLPYPEQGLPWLPDSFHLPFSMWFSIFLQTIFITSKYYYYICSSFYLLKQTPTNYKFHTEPYLPRLHYPRRGIAESLTIRSHPQWPPFTLIRHMTVLACLNL